MTQPNGLLYQKWYRRHLGVKSNIVYLSGMSERHPALYRINDSHQFWEDSTDSGGQKAEVFTVFKSPSIGKEVFNVAVDDVPTHIPSS